VVNILILRKPSGFRSLALITKTIRGEHMEVFDKLLEVMAALRSPGGCPWDMEQTHRSLKPYLIEEAYELLEAIDKGDPSKTKEELGDILLHVIFHARIAEEAGHFTMEDVIEALRSKLIERHPHVFGDMENVRTAEQVLSKWENIKAETAGERNYYVLNGLPAAMPALLKAYRIQEKVARFGFDWENPIEILDKLEEERIELKEKLKSGDTDAVSGELGDLLFTAVNICRHYRIYPEDALNATCEKFRARFKLMEDYIRDEGKKLGELTLEELDSYWDRAKISVK
jgi:tetrapyrrole methylase family protein/MazG family protein